MEIEHNLSQAEYHLTTSCMLDPNLAEPWCGIVYLKLQVGAKEEARRNIEILKRKFAEQSDVCHDVALLVRYGDRNEDEEHMSETSLVTADGGG
eukprot:767776-Hanusia_phi.AAC.6